MRIRSRHRGLTILEAVLATVLLGMIATALSSTIATAQKSAERNKIRLAAFEAANRVVLQWLDDKTSMPSHNYNDGTYSFHWEIETLPLGIENPDNAARIPPTDGPPASLLKAQLLIVARVYEGLPDGIGGTRPGDLLAELRRTHNPIVVLSGRNPDSTIRMAQSKDRTGTIMVEIMGGSSGSKPSSGSSGSRPGGSSPSRDFVGPGNPPKR